MKPQIAAAATVLMLLPTVVQAASLLTERQARAKAIAILKGDPYGRTASDVAKIIKRVRFAPDGRSPACGEPVKVPLWEFHVVVVTDNKDQFDHGKIDGYLALDARSGKMRCANLPLLD